MTVERSEKTAQPPSVARTAACGLCSAAHNNFSSRPAHAALQDDDGGFDYDAALWTDATTPVFGTGVSARNTLLEAFVKARLFSSHLRASHSSDCDGMAAVVIAVASTGIYVDGSFSSAACLCRIVLEL